MLKIGEKTFMNIQEAVQWLLDNNALPYQSSANYVADTEIGLGTISNPSPAKVRIGSLILFADGKVATVNGLTSSAFIVGSQYVDLSNTAKYVVSATVDGAGDLIFTLSDGSTINAGLIKQISSFAISGTNLIAYYNDGTSTDCGPLFVGSLTLPADLTVTDDLIVGGDATFGQITNFNGNVVIASGKNLTVGGGASFQTANFYDVATFEDEAFFNNPVTMNDNLSVDGDFSISRDGTIGGDLSVIGDIRASNLSLSGNTTVSGDLTVSGSAKLFENIVDQNGHLRFVEGDITTSTTAGITYTYAKWSLSGTHLLIVLAGKIDNGTALIADALFGSLNNLPSWVKDKIFVLYGAVVENKTISVYNPDWTAQSMSIYLRKVPSEIDIRAYAGFTASKDRNFRIAFDLLIDNE